MPLEPTTPESKPIPSITNKDVTHFHITRLNITIDPNDAAATAVALEWAEGYMDTGAFVPVEAHQANLSGPGVIAKINEITDGTTSVYNNVKQRVWAMLQTEGLAPAGSIT
jgi:hypothetical protein